jgi:hypothetical protein
LIQAEREDEKVKGSVRKDSSDEGRKEGRKETGEKAALWGTADCSVVPRVVICK